MVEPYRLGKPADPSNVHVRNGSAFSMYKPCARLQHGTLVVDLEIMRFAHGPGEVDSRIVRERMRGLAR